MIEFERPTRPIDRVFIHCSASDKSELRGPKLYEWTLDIHVRGHGWSDIGYHWLIDKRAALISGRPLETEPAAQKGHNTGTLAIMVHGLHHFTAESLDALHQLCQAINEAYRGKITFHGHCEVNPQKTCPVFDYKGVLYLDKWGRMPARPDPKRKAASHGTDPKTS